MDHEEADLKEYRFGHIVVEAPRKGACPVCAFEHPIVLPHNPASLYYRMKFRQEHGRFPDWVDAMAHCPEYVQIRFTEHLANHGIFIRKPSDGEHPPE